MRAGIRLAHARGVTAIHDKDGWLGAPRLWQRLHEEGSADAARLAVAAPRAARRARGARACAPGSATTGSGSGYLKAFMDGALGSGTAWLLDGSGVRITSGEELADVVRRAARAGWPVAVHAIGDRANREALDAFEATREEWWPRRLRQRVEHAQCLTARTCPALRGSSASPARPVQPRARPTATSPIATGPIASTGAYAFRSLWDSGAAARERLGRPHRGARPARSASGRPYCGRSTTRAAWRPEQGLTVEQALARQHRRTPPGSPATSARAGGSCPAASQISSSSTATPSTARPAELGELAVVATMVGGRWVHNPPPWD